MADDSPSIGSLLAALAPAATPTPAATPSSPTPTSPTPTSLTPSTPAPTTPAPPAPTTPATPAAGPLAGPPPEAVAALNELAAADPAAVARLQTALAPYTLNAAGTGPSAPEPMPRLDAPAEDTFVALLLPANRSGVLGAVRAEFDEQGGTVAVEARITGLTPDEVHALHIHGRPDNGPSLIPNASLDADRDGFVEDPEGEHVVGPVILALTEGGAVSDAVAVGDFPAADGSGVLTLDETFAFDLEDPGQLARFEELRDRFTGREVQVHGLEVAAGAGAGTPFEVDGAAGYKATLPVANGILLPVVEGNAADAAVLALAERLLGGAEDEAAGAVPPTTTPGTPPPTTPGNGTTEDGTTEDGDGDGGVDVANATPPTHTDLVF
jgi:hypothetical protein